MSIPYKVVAERHDGAWQSAKPADKTDSMSTVQSTEGAELETDDSVWGCYRAGFRRPT